MERRHAQKPKVLVLLVLKENCSRAAPHTTCFSGSGTRRHIWPGVPPRPCVVHLGSINPNNWLPLLAFRKRLIAGEVTPESSTSSVASTVEGGETATVRGIRKTVCRPISAAKKQQILDLEPTGMSARAIARQVGTSTSTVKAVCRQAKQPPSRKRRFTDDDLRRAQQLYAQGRTYIEIGLELGFGRDTVSKHLAAAQA